MDLAATVFLVGLFIGSFLNVCICRIPREESLVYPPSHCPACQERIKWVDLVPVLSYLSLKGRCRSCGTGISPQYPLVELLNGFLWLLLYLQWGLSLHLLKALLFTSLLVVISFIDYHRQIIPDGLNLAGVVLGGIFLFLPSAHVSVWQGIIGLIVGGSLFLLIALVSRGGMGGGDVKLMGVLGLALGWQQVLLVSLLAFVLGAVISGFLLLLKIKGCKDPVPFGPFICTGAYISLLAGDWLLAAYLNLVSQQ